MAKYEFEWTDLQVTDMQLVLDGLLGMERLPPSRRSLLHGMANQIAAQKPVPLPTRIGAVIRGKVYEISQDRTFICAGSNSWIEADGDLYQTPPIKTWTVLSEGVDL